jgi:hypothetical protein
MSADKCGFSLREESYIGRRDNAAEWGNETIGDFLAALCEVVQQQTFQPDNYQRDLRKRNLTTREALRHRGKRPAL